MEPRAVAHATTTEDRRIAKTKRALRSALIELVEERGLEDVTVNNLCERADLNRGTFYNHFKDKDELVCAFEEELMQGILVWQESLNRVKLTDMVAYRVAGKPLPFLVNLFDYLREESDFLHAILGPQGDGRFRRQVREVVCDNLVKNILHEKYRTNPTVFVDYYVAFYASAYLGVILHWIERGAVEDSQTMALIAARLLFIKPGESIEL